MKKIYITTVFAIFGLAKSQNSLTLNITNLNANKGNVEIGLFNKKEGFLKNGFQFLKKKIKVIGNNISYTFTNLPKGEYAVAVYQDENLNNKCDTNFIGIPTESYGFSNNFKPKLSAPKFEQTKFLVEDKKIINIALIN